MKQSEAGKRVAAKVVSMNYGGYKITEADREKVAEWVDEELDVYRRELRVTAEMLQMARAECSEHNRDYHNHTAPVRLAEWRDQADKALALAGGDK